MDNDVGRYQGAMAEGRAVPLRHPSIRLGLPAQIRRRAMPMLFWLPMIFASVLLEMNGFPPQVVEAGPPASPRLSSQPNYD